MVVAELHRFIDVTGAGDALFDHAHRFQSKRHTRRLDANPGTSRTTIGSFFIRAATARTVAVVSFEVSPPITISTRTHDVNRIEEMHSITFAGRAEALAISVMEKR
jgi:hypothetical protein